MALNDIRDGSYYIGTFENQQRFVKFDLNAFAEMEKMYGSMEAANEALSRGTMQDIRKILWVGLIHDQAVLDEHTGEPIKYNITPYQVGSWLTPANMQDVMKKLMEAINGSMPESDDNMDEVNANATQVAQAANPANVVELPNKDDQKENFPQVVPGGTGTSTTM